MGFDYDRYFGEISLTHDLMTRPEERTWRLTAPEREPGHHDVVLYLGCNVLRTSHMIRTVTAVLDRLGVDHVAVGGPTYCCGIVHHQQGDAAAGGGMGRRTIELFRRWAPREVAMWCPSCIHYYDEVLAAPLPFPVRHVTEFLAERLPAMSFTREVRSRVALHHHVQGEARQRESRACRRLLAAVPGLSVVDIEGTAAFGRSCAPAVPQQLGVERWNALALDEMDRARAAGADTLATIYHGCQRMLCGFEAERPMAIEHYLSVFARGLGIEFEDTYKRYRLSGDPEAILEDMTPCMAANGVDPGAARAFVSAHFAPPRRAPDAAPS
jgi:Fe-S oxidoreductase